MSELITRSSDIPSGLGGTTILPELRALIARGHDATSVALDRDIEIEVLLEGDHLTIFVESFRQWCHL